MLNNSDMFETGDCFDPNSITYHQQLLTDHHDVSNNFSTIQSPANHLHHQHLMNMEVDHQIHQQINWNHTLHDQFLMGNNGNNFSPSVGFSDPTQIHQNLSQIVYDPLLNLTGCGSVFGEMDMERGEQSEMFEFGSGRDNKDTKHFANEKHRRQQLNGKFEALRSLIPNPTKGDRASIVGDSIEYIKKLKTTLEDLKISVDRKRCIKGRMKKHKTEDESNLDVESTYTRSNGGGHNGNTTSTMKSSWLHRKSKDAEIDVRIIDDEVTIKLVQQKRTNCLLHVSKVVDEFNLDITHVAGGLIGDFYSYLFNNKICEGSSVYASNIANKLIEVVDMQLL